MRASTPPIVWDLAQAAGDPLSPLLQFGITGTVLAIALVALRSVYQAQITTLEKTVETERIRSKELVAAERDRADRIEAQLTGLNEAVRERLLTSMASSAETFREALRALEGGGRR